MKSNNIYTGALKKKHGLSGRNAAVSSVQGCQLHVIADTLRFSTAHKCVVTQNQVWHEKISNFT